MFVLVFLLLLVLFSCVAAVWCSLLFVQLPSAFCADFSVVCAFCCFCCSFCCLCCCFKLLLLPLFGSPTVEPPPLPLLTFQNVKNNGTIGEAPFDLRKCQELFFVSRKTFCIPKKTFVSPKKTFVSQQNRIRPAECGG